MGVDGKCVDGTGQFGRECRIYHAMTVDPALPFEGFGHDIHPEMRLAARPVACVAFMQMRFIRDIETFRGESFAQLFCDVIFCCHDLRTIARYPVRSIVM